MKEDAMALMERVTTLLRANVNDLIDRAEDPEKMLKQLLLDMENQLLQVKTQVAVAIAGQHLLDRRQKEELAAAVSWRARAELAVGKGEDELARRALERALQHDELAAGFTHQAAAQHAEADNLRSTYNQLQTKLQQTQAQAEMLLAEHRRARMVSKATAAQRSLEARPALRGNALGRLKARVHGTEAENHAGRTMLEGDNLEDRFARLERGEKIDGLLEEMKQRQSRLLEAG
jgi:phage shock protein A